MLINVTEQHIKAGIRSSYVDCPISLAIKGHLPNCAVSTDYTVIQILKNGHITKYRVPPEVYSFILDFDDNLEVKPFSFKLTKV